MDSTQAACRLVFRALALVAFAVLLIGTVLRPSVAHACLWDRDTLATEFEGAESVVHAIVGRFPRNPPLFYEMRLARIEQELAGNPADRLALLDDAAVACDRLGRSDCAISFMVQKKLLLDDPNLRGYSPEHRREHEYRYLANLGTFHAHKALTAGEPQGPDMVIAVDLIRQAIALNPRAHFGREAVQLMILELFLNPPAEMVTSRDIYAEFDPNLQAAADYDDDVVQGLAGLVLLGNAWESVLVFELLGMALEVWRDHAVLARLAQHRADELAAGQVERPAWLGPRRSHYQFDEPNIQDIETYYRTARHAAAEWHAHRTRYMLTRLENGEHPDTHPEFWRDYVELAEPPPPAGDHTPFLYRVQFLPPGITTFLEDYPFVWILAIIGLLVAWIRVAGRSTPTSENQLENNDEGAAAGIVASERVDEGSDSKSNER